MAEIAPFRGSRYDGARVVLDDVVSPPYDVLGEDDVRTLRARSPYNAVHVDLPAAPGDEAEATAQRLDGPKARGQTATRTPAPRRPSGAGTTRASWSATRRPRSTCSNTPTAGPTATNASAAASSPACG